VGRFWREPFASTRQCKSLPMLSDRDAFLVFISTFAIYILWRFKSKFTQVIVFDSIVIIHNYGRIEIFICELSTILQITLNSWNQNQNGYHYSPLLNLQHFIKMVEDEKFKIATYR
jgi:hypothetical protein